MGSWVDVADSCIELDEAGANESRGTGVIGLTR